MGNHRRPKIMQHVVLAVEVVFEELFVCAAAGGPSGLVHGGREVDGDFVHVVDGAEEEVDGGGGCERFDEWEVGLADPFTFKAHKNLDPVGV